MVGVTIEALVVATVIVARLPYWRFGRLLPAHSRIHGLSASDPLRTFATPARMSFEALMRYQEVYPSAAILRSFDVVRPRASELLNLEYFEVDPDTMPTEVSSSTTCC
jgi:hypothetical protein